MTELFVSEFMDEAQKALSKVKNTPRDKNDVL